MHAPMLQMRVKAISEVVEQLVRGVKAGTM